MTAAERLVEWAWSLDAASIPVEVEGSVRRHLLDGYGCALAAYRVGAALPALRVADDHRAVTGVRVPGGSDRYAMPYAALATGALVHALDFDDTHPVALVHATAAVLPTLLAVGQQAEAGPNSLLLAAVGGYETVIRLGAAIPHGFHARGLHATSVCGVFAAALIAARLLALTEAQAVSALGIAGSLAAGSLEFLDAGSDTKALHPGLAALSGITAAQLAAAGAQGPASILEGRYGLYASYLQQSPPPIGDDLGQRWTLSATEVKPYPCCQLSHASIAALLSMPRKVVAGQILAVDVDLPAAAVPIVAEPRDVKLHPRSAYDAKFSLPWTLAAAAIDGELTVDTFAGTGRSEIHDLARRVNIRPRSDQGPPATARGRLHVTTRDGRTEVVTVNAGRSMTDGEILAKFTANAGDKFADDFAAAVLEDGWRNPWSTARQSPV